VEQAAHVINNSFDEQDINQDELGAMTRNLQQNKLQEVYLRIEPKPRPRFASSRNIMSNDIIRTPKRKLFPTG